MELKNRANKGLEVEYRIKENVPATVLGGFSMLRQILVNLISNAVKFTGRGRISITVFGRKKEGDRYEIHFAVKDTGIGIPEDKADRLSMLSASILDGSESLLCISLEFLPGRPSICWKRSCRERMPQRFWRFINPQRDTRLRGKIHMGRFSFANAKME